MVSGSISRRYAKALLQLGIESRDYELLGQQLDRVNALVQGNAELKSALESPVFPLSQRKAILQEVLRRLIVNPVVEHFVLLVLDRNRFAALPQIARAYGVLVDEQAGRVRATVTSARPLREPDVLRIKAALEKRTGKHVLVEKKEDPALIAGLVVQIGDVVWDGSVRTQLEQVQQQLLASD